MEKQLTPEQLSGLEKIKSIFEAVIEQIREAAKLVSENQLDEQVSIFSILETDNFDENGKDQNSSSVHRAITGDQDNIIRSLASLAEDQTTPWLCKGYKNAASEALENKMFSLSRKVSDILGE